MKAGVQFLPSVTLYNIQGGIKELFRAYTVIELVFLFPMLKMMYTATPFIILVGFLMTPILASEQNVINNLENVTLSSTENVTNTAVTTMSTMTNATVNETDMTQTYSPTTQEHPTRQKLPDSKASPSPPAVQPTPTLSKPPTKTKENVQDIVMTTPKPQSEGNDSVGIIILVVLIIIVLLGGLVCYVARSRGRRYSVDLTSRPDEAQIPLSTVEPEGLVETVTSNGLQFEGTENSPLETQEPEANPKEQVEQKAENPEDQPKQDIPEQKLSAPVEPSNEEKTDNDEGREGDASNKTSLESLKEGNESNENNSNSSLLPQRGAREAETFWDVSLHNMV